MLEAAPLPRRRKALGRRGRPGVGRGACGCWVCGCTAPRELRGCRRCSDACVPASLPPVLGSSEGLSERGSLARIGAVVDVIQSSSSEVGLRLAGLKHIVKILEEEPEAEQQVGKAWGGLEARTVG